MINFKECVESQGEKTLDAGARCGCPVCAAMVAERKKHYDKIISYLGYGAALFGAGFLARKIL